MTHIQAIEQPETELLVENRPMSQSDEAFVVEHIRLYKARQQEKRAIDSVLHEIFSASPLPEKLEKLRLDWVNGKLQHAAAIRIVLAYSDYQVQVFCVAKN